MTPVEAMQAANDARPDLMLKIAVSLAATEKISPSMAQDVVSELIQISSSTTEKVASVGGWQGYGASLGGVALSAIGGALASDLYDAARRGLTKSTSLKRIVEANPSLKEHKMSAIETAFNTVHRYAPEFTSDPNLGGQVIQNMLELPQNQVNMVKELINARKNIRDVRKNQFSMGTTPFKIDGPLGSKSS